VHDPPAALGGGYRRKAPWGRVSRNLQERMSSSAVIEAAVHEELLAALGAMMLAAG